jgi:hypothetical protein
VVALVAIFDLSLRPHEEPTFCLWQPPGLLVLAEPVIFSLHRSSVSAHPVASLSKPIMQTIVRVCESFAWWWLFAGMMLYRWTGMVDVSMITIDVI